MYVVDRPSRRPPAAALPSYDVKIIAGRRVVIFHDPAKQSPKVERAETTPKATPDNPHVADDVEDTCRYVLTEDHARLKLAGCCYAIFFTFFFF